MMPAIITRTALVAQSTEKSVRCSLLHIVFTDAIFSRPQKNVVFILIEGAGHLSLNFDLDDVLRILRSFFGRSRRKFQEIFPFLEYYGREIDNIIIVPSWLNNSNDGGCVHKFKRWPDARLGCWCKREFSEMKMLVQFYAVV